jgi:hypothetical protein
MPREVELIGVPANSSGTAEGVARAPGVLRERGLTAVLASRPRWLCQKIRLLRRTNMTASSVMVDSMSQPLRDRVALGWNPRRRVRR